MGNGADKTIPDRNLQSSDGFPLKEYQAKSNNLLSKEFISFFPNHFSLARQNYLHAAHRHKLFIKSFYETWLVKLTLSHLAACYGAAIGKQNSYLNVIGPQVRRIRERKGWTQNDLALKLQLWGWDTSRESVTRLEGQTRRIPDMELFVLARILGVKTDELFPRNLRSKAKQLAPYFRVKLSRGQVPPTA